MGQLLVVAALCCARPPTSKKLHDLITNKESREASQRGKGGDQEEDAGQIREEEVDVVLEEDEEADVHRIRLPEFPGGAEAFELAAKFCYGIKLDLTPTTAALLRCAAERLGMSDDHSEDNLVSRADRFMSQTVLRNPRDAIRALKSCEGLLPLVDDLGLVSRCVDAVADDARDGDHQRRRRGHLVRRPRWPVLGHVHPCHCRHEGARPRCSKHTPPRCQ
ncbi:unnamed protein product [Miscanthus lutarioriparius]|uniref:Uncharacterized protein n=1 Tax=Miscanthus lutarioriparius TaxID=422564 RepID=A0A811QJU6_9POAL|nr:unnamed protein product [Miscanthus lutarioriparius]